MLAKKTVQGRVGAVSLVGIGLAFAIGCGPEHLIKPAPPEAPEAPRYRYETLDEAVVTPVVLNSNRNGDYQLGKNQAIAIMNFADSHAQGGGGTSGSGALVADSLILDLQRRGYRVIDRDQIDKVIKEQERIGQGLAKLSEVEVAKKIGELVAADFFLFGSVTEYASEGRSVPLSKLVVQSDIERYETDVREYDHKQKEWQKKCDDYNEKAQRQGNADRCRWPKAPTIDTWQENYYKDSRQVYSPVARVGLTAKLVNVATSSIMWVGQANVSDTSLQKGMSRITAKMIEDFTGSGQRR